MLEFLVVIKNTGPKHFDELKAIKSEKKKETQFFSPKLAAHLTGTTPEQKRATVSDIEGSTKFEINSAIASINQVPNQRYLVDPPKPSTPKLPLEDMTKDELLQESKAISKLLD